MSRRRRLLPGPLTLRGLLVAVALLTVALWILASPLQRARVWHHLGYHEVALQQTLEARGVTPAARGRLLTRVCLTILEDPETDSTLCNQALRSLRDSWPLDLEALVPRLLADCRSTQLTQVRRDDLGRLLRDLTPADPEVVRWHASRLQEALPGSDEWHMTLSGLSGAGPAAAPRAPTLVARARRAIAAGTDLTPLCRVLGEIDWQEATSLPALLELLDSDDPGHQVLALQMIHGLGPAARGATDRLWELHARPGWLQGPGQREWWLVSALGVVGGQEERLLPIVSRKVREWDLNTYSWIRAARLGTHGKALVPDLLARLDGMGEGSVSPRLALLDLLEELGAGPEELVPRVQVLQRDPMIHRLDHQASQLFQLLERLPMEPRERMIPALEWVRNHQSRGGYHGESPSYFRSALWFLVRQGARARELAPVLWAHIDACPLEQEDRWLLQALVRIDPDSPRILPALLTWLETTEGSERATLALGHLGLRARPAIGPLRELLEGPSARVRIAAAAALHRIEGPGAGTLPLALAPIHSYLREHVLRVVEELGLEADAAPALRSVLEDTLTRRRVRERVERMLAGRAGG